MIANAFLTASALRKVSPSSALERRRKFNRPSPFGGASETTVYWDALVFHTGTTFGRLLGCRPLPDIIGSPAGIILWELKRTKAWSDGWLPKLREDQRRCGADVALIISQALPKHIEHFDLVDNVWVAHPRCALPVAVALRQSLIELSNSRFVQQGQESKMEQVYKYLTGMKFRQRVEAVIEKFNDMRDELDRERKFMGKQWSKREAQILAVVDSTVGMVGDLQGIAGKAMPEIPSLDMPLLEASFDPEAKVL
jgi:hypothetical protein